MTRQKRDLPPRCYLKHGAFFYVTPQNKWVNLGRDREAALRQYRALTEATAPLDTVPGLIGAARASILQGKAVSTQDQYTLALDRLAVIFGEFRVEDVRPKHIAAVKVEMRGTPNMANRFLTVLRLLFAYAVEAQLCDWNPAQGIKPYKENRRKRLISPDEIDRILAHCSPRMAVMVDLLRLTGQRITDVINIRHGDITDDGLVFVQQKTDSKVLIRWNPDLRAAVDRAKALTRSGKPLPINVKALARPDPAAPLFRTRFGGPPSYKTVYDQWVAAAKKAGVEDANQHDLKAVAVTDAHRQGLDPQGLAGHSSARMTERYIREKMGVEVEAPRLSKKVSKNV